jgi:hypothetical protein
MDHLRSPANVPRWSRHCTGGLAANRRHASRRSPGDHVPVNYKGRLGVASLVAHHTVVRLQPAPWRLAGRRHAVEDSARPELDDGAERRGKQPLVLSTADRAWLETTTP